MKNKLFITAVVGSLLTFQSCKPEEITPNEVSASGSINLNGTIYANANESDDFISGVRIDAANNTGNIRIHKSSNFDYWYEHFAFPTSGPGVPSEYYQQTFACFNQNVPKGAFLIPRVLGKFGNPITGSELPTSCTQITQETGDTVLWDGFSTFNQSFDIFNFMERKGQKVAGVVVTAQYSTEDIASWTADTIQYPMQVVTTTTDANGRYSLSIPASGKPVFVTVSIGGKTLDHIYVNEADIIETSTETFLTEPLYYTAKEWMNTIGLNPGATLNSYVLNLNAGASVTQNFILTPQ